MTDPEARPLPPVAAQLARYAPGVVAGTSAAIWSAVPDLTTRAVVVSGLILVPALWWILRTLDRWPIVLLAALLCLPPLPIPMGDSGPHPALAVAAVGALAGIIGWRRRDQALPAVSLWLLGYPLVILGSVSLAALYSGPAVATASLARVLLFGISIYLFFYTAAGRKEGEDVLSRDLRIVFWAGVVSATFACVDFYYQFPAPAGFGPQFVWLDSGVYRRAQGFFYEASTLGNICAFFLVMVMVSLVRPKDQGAVRRPAMVAGAAVLVAALLLSFSRASIVNLCVAAPVLLMINRRVRTLVKLGGIIAVSAAAGIALAYAVAPEFVEFYWLRLSVSLGLLVSGNEAALSGRLENWRFLVNFLAAHPEHAIFGVGYKTLPYSDFIGRPVVADNAYLSALVETGLAGLATLLAFHAAILSMGWRAARSANRHAQFLGAWITCFWAGEMVQMLSGDLLTYWRVLPVYFWVLAMAVRSSRLPSSP